MLHPSRSRRSSSAFTLLEMMVVILIIGILSGSFVVMMPEMVDKAKMTANEQNMTRLYQTFLSYQQDHSGSWPRDNGQRFFLRLWKDRVVDRTEKNAKLFFSPAEDVGLYVMDGQTTEDYLDDWDGIGPGSTSYAGFNDFGERAARRKLRSDPGHTTIVSDAMRFHRTAMIYLTADGSTHRLLFPELAEKEGLILDEILMEGAVVAGPDSLAPELRTVSND